MCAAHSSWNPVSPNCRKPEYFPLVKSLTYRLVDKELRLDIVHNRRARRYLLRIRHDGSLRLTIPRFGNQVEALGFLERQRNWILKHRDRALLQAPKISTPLGAGSNIWFRGEKVTLEQPDGMASNIFSFADQRVITRVTQADWRPALQQHLRKLASLEFPARVMALAREHQLEVRRVSIRDQKSRWGSCSMRKTISLNWRLIQAPPFVLDYVIVHELMHLKEMNHSNRFWQHVANAFPQHRDAELWLKEFGKELR